METTLLHRLITGYWILISVLILAGGVVSWVQLKFNSHEPVSKYLARLRLSCAMVAVIFLASTNGIVNAWAVMPVFTLYSLLAVTLMAGALWSWIFYSIGILNGHGWVGVIKRLFDPKNRRRTMEKRYEDEHASLPPADKPDNAGGRPQQPDPSGVVDGPGKSEDNPPSEPPPDRP